LTNKKVKLKETVVFTRQLAATLSAGLVLVEALEVVADDMENKYFQSIIRSARSDIQGGMDFSTALARYPRIFSIGYVSLVRAGEATGRLYKSMTDLAVYLEKSMSLREKVKSALSYPLFVMGFAFVVVAVVVLFLIPKFQEIFAQAGAELPWLTRMVVGVSEASLRFWPLFLAAAFIAGIVFIKALKIPKFRFQIDKFILKIPIIGKDIIHKSLMSRFSHTLGALLSGGVPLATSLDITGQVVDHLPISEATRHIRDRVVGGANMSDEVKAQILFPSLVSKMIAVGERTGTISEMLKRTANYYDDELDNTLQKLTALIEPVLIIFIGGFICIIIVALYLPIFTVTRLVI
jgi:type IV pilus assembly protein PilC